MAVICSMAAILVHERGRMREKEAHLLHLMGTFARQDKADSLLVNHLPEVAKRATRVRTVTQKKKGIAGAFGGNLLSNAIKFTRSGIVTLSTGYKNGIFTLTVEDTGTGMTGEQQARIFIPFERLGNAVTEDGFGLAIDNNGMLLDMMKEMYRQNGVDCNTCQTAGELTDLMRTKDYDLLITDLKMPEVNGYEVLELLAATTQSDMDEVRKAAEAGDMEALNKLGVKWDEGATQEEKLERIITHKY